MKFLTSFALGATFVASGAAAALAASAPRMELTVRNTLPRAGFVATSTRAMIPVRTVDLGRMPAAMPMRVTVGLATLDRKAVDAMIRRQNTPGDAMYRHYFTPAQTTAFMSPSGASVLAVARYLRANGFTKMSVTRDNLILEAEGPTSAVERAFDTEMHVTSVAGKRHFMNVRGASVPADLSHIVRSVTGLNSVAAMHSMAQIRESAAKPAGATCTQVPVTSFCTLNDYGPRELITAYDFGNDAYGQASIGGPYSGLQTNIGIIMEGDLTTVATDLRAEENSEALPPTSFTVVPVGTASSDTSGLDEWDMDSQSSSGIAGNVKRMYWYDATSLTDADLSLAFDQMKTDDIVKAGSASIGECEAFPELDGSMQTDDAIFQGMALQGQSFFASTGDTGGSCAVEGTNGVPDSGPPEPEYPADSPYVIGVGGTTLLTTPANVYQGEIPWYAGGGGVSLFETAPPWQASVVPTAISPLGLRSTPDISMDADPDTGFNVFVSGVSEEIGGTSLASPLALGVWARLESVNDNALGPAGPIFYREFSDLSASSTYRAGALTRQVGGFNDVIAGTNGTYPATPGWDLATGLGSLDIRKQEANLFK